MKQIKFTVLLTVLMGMVGAKALANDIEVKNADGVTIYYNFINNNTELEVTYQGNNPLASNAYAGSVVIPESVNYDGKTYQVTSIGNHSFFRCSDLSSVTIPNGVTNIGVSAFFECSSLSSIVIPSSVANIGSDALRGCGLNSIQVETDNAYYDSRDNCNALIKTSDNQLLTGSNSAVIPNSVTSIAEDAFDGCSGLLSVTISSSVVNIERGAFRNCRSLASITVDAANANYNSRDNCNAIIKTSDNTLISGCMTTVIPNGVMSIGENAFYGSGLTSIVIPGSVKSIGIQALCECSGLTSVTIPNSVVSIGYRAFDGCSNLQTIVSLIQTPFFMGGFVFTKETFDNATLYVPAGTLSKYQATEGWKDFAHIVEGTPSGISTAKVAEAAVKESYTLDGKRIGESKHGLNIVRMSDGTTKKVVVN